MRSHKAVVFNFCICTTKNAALTRITHYQHGWRLLTLYAVCIASNTIPMRVDMYRKLKKLYMKKVGIRRPPQAIKGKHETGNCDHRKFILPRNKQSELHQRKLDQRPFCLAHASLATSV